MDFIRIGIVLIAITVFAPLIMGCNAGDVSSELVGGSATYSISGNVAGAPAAGVAITMTGTVNAATTTDASGNYNFADIPDGNYIVTPALAGFLFNPASTAVTISGSNVVASTFTAIASAAPTYGIAGKVNGSVLQGVVLTLSGAANATMSTDTNGNYSFTGLASGSYTVTPSRTGYRFVSASTTVSITNANVTSVNFGAMAHAGPTYSISGTVSGVIQQGVTIGLSGAACATTLTDAGGNYSFAGLPAGSFTVYPVTWLTCSFDTTPRIANVTISNSSVTGTDFTLTAGNPCLGAGIGVTMHSISGTVSGAVQQGVVMLLTGPMCRTTTTDAGGSYAFSDYFPNGTYTVTPAFAGHTFSPASAPISYSGSDVTGTDFTAM